MSTHANMVKMTAAAPGTGTITLGSASSGHRTFAQGYGSANATVAGIRIEDAADPTIWEAARDCAYTHSGTTLGRGTFEDSSTGSLVNFTGAVVVSVVATADSGRRWDSAALVSVAATVTTADVTGVVGQMSELDISGLTAARALVLPAGAVDDRIGVRLSVGDETYELNIKGDTGISINGGTAAAIFTCLVQAGEFLVFKATSTTNWRLDVDGRSNLAWRVQSNDSTTQNISTATLTTITTALPEFAFGVAQWYSSGIFTPKRPGKWLIGAALGLVTTTTDAIAAAESTIAGAIYKNDGNNDSISLGTIPVRKSAASGVESGGFSPSGIVTMNGSTDSARVKVYQDTGFTLATAAADRKCNFWGVWIGD